ncbi:hypothetical protein D0Z07_3254 [Hyphodiscus hymeniophilus]|uniref:Glycosyltransferase family 31 protein n=1 Tax=Hyphodiscus hymeniophilus TaxID=353542 RepID=A0A9P7AYR5_9HELO|nr:hypothetical protein D0Z07_3254 [Hyphodiscus hymeniophilus]
MLPRTPLLRWVGVTFLVALLVYFHPTFTGTTIRIVAESGAPIPHSQQSEDDFTFVKQVLKDNHIGPEITYASRTIQYVPDAPYRKSITEVDDVLFPNEFAEITINRKISLPVGRSVKLHVHQSPRPDQVDASSLIFGASTTFERFTGEETSPVKEWKRWLTDGHGHTNGAGLVLALFNTSTVEIAHVTDELVAAGINATVVASDMKLDMPGRYVSLVSMLYNHPTRDSRKYFALIDDDTFFPCISALVDKLSNYDPARPYYIGTFTERVDWMIGNRAPMAYGGGGVFLTAPVARQILQLPCLEKDKKDDYVLKADQGDRLLYNCLRNYTEIRLTYLPLLHQSDQFGDPSGFYESGQQALSLHHYKSWHHIHPDRLHVVADACGEDCLLQRFQFKDNFILSNGFSVAHYPKGIDFDPLIMEGTFDNGDGDMQDVSLSYTFGGLRKNLAKTGRKLAWELLDARQEGDGRVRQIYLKRRGDGRWVPEGEEHPERDSIVVLVWKP